MIPSTELTPQEVTTGMKSFPFNSINPFVKDIVGYITDKNHRKAVGTIMQEVVNPQTGEITQQTALVLGEKKQVDTQEWFKIYREGVIKFFGLSKNSYRLFDYLMSNIKFSQDRICIYIPTVMQELNVSRPAVYRGLKQLLESQIIARADSQNCYFINPNIAFKGDRILFYKEYCKAEDKQSKTIE